MRISTSAMHELAVTAMLRQQAELAKTQNQIATGKRVQKPSDDPVAAAQLYELARAQSQEQQYGNNSTIVTGRLQTEEQALGDATTLLQRARELVIQANTATLSDGDRTSIATELKVRLDELVGIANRRDANGDYLFAGYASGTLPFARGANGLVNYSGDSGVRSVQVEAGLSVQDSDTGSRVFMSVPAGNGLFTTTASAANTGSGVIDVGSITNRNAWVPGVYKLSFPTASTWQVTDSLNAPVANGNYTSGGSIAFNGIQVSISGSPAAGDTYTVASAGTQDMFSTLNGIVAALKGGGSNDALRAQLNSSLNGSLQQLDQASERLLDVRAQVGARLSMLGDADNSRQAQIGDLQAAASQLGDLDYAAAISKMSQQTMSLQAAQQSFASIAKLSLFNYL
jgi:flagellar hook-associated protein 3 FlgL